MSSVFTQDSDVLVVTPPGGGDPIRLRWPTFQEWYDLASAHRSLGTQSPPVDLIAKTIATCLDGADKGVREKILKGSPRVVMWLYKKCWETVLKNDDEAVSEIEKNCEASRDS